MILSRATIVLFDDRIVTVSTRYRVWGTGRSCSEVPVSDQTAWQTTISQIFAGIRNDLGRAQVSIVLALASTTVRVIDGLPHSSDAKTIRQIIVSSPFRYIPRRFTPLVSEVVPVGSDKVLVAFAELDVVRNLVRACDRAGLDLREISIVRDHASVCRETSSESMTSNVERMLADAMILPKAGWISTARTVKQKWRPHGLTVIGVALLLVIATLAPVWRLMIAHRDSQRATSRVRQVEIALQRAAQLDSLRAPLEHARSTAARSAHPLIVLEKLGNALGADARILSFEADSTLVQATVVAPSLVPFLRRLERDSKVRNVAVIGGIAHDSANDGIMERALIRFRYIGNSTTIRDTELSR